ncbi:rotatin isoform X1 [Lethenteron reissneri]|uniref:rotatin isoform X1 n=1 Tax=Lethenteron reissneri TaxID=7753 RepID=UPI002AB65785|nr:rotatin isoform X1 [Lethenteron reissneri]
MDVPSLVNKLGHHLEEIRVRALKNLLLKLEHGLLAEADLVQEKRLLVRLLEWFNFPSVPMQKEVLGLLHKLSQHSSAAGLLVEIGALEFLAQLRPNVQASLQAPVDSIMDCLLRLPTVQPETPSVMYSANSPPEDTHQQGSLALKPMQADGNTGYFIHSKKEKDIPKNNIILPVNDVVKCLKFSTFPWLCLTPNDKHVLTSTERSLRSKNASLIRSSCDFLLDVMMCDFPAETFLQRPNIVENLLLLLRLAGGADGTHHLALHALRCLHHLCRNLTSRLCFHRDPAFFSTKPDVDYQNSSVSSSGTSVESDERSATAAATSPRPSTQGHRDQRPRGDGRDGDLSSSASSTGSSESRNETSSRATPSPLELGTTGGELDADFTLELQLQQWGLPNFCLMAMQPAIDMLKTGSSRDVLGVLELLASLSSLLSESLTSDVWQDNSLIGRDLAERMSGILESLAEVVSYHYTSRVAEGQPEPQRAHHRLAFNGCALAFLRLVQMLVPLEQAGTILPGSVVSALSMISLDVPFCRTFPTACDAAWSFLEQASSECHSLSTRVASVTQSMECTCTFLREFTNQDDGNMLELIELADQAVESIPYHLHLPFIQHFITLCSKIHKTLQPSPTAAGESRKVLLKLLSHPVNVIRANVYSNCLNIVQESLGIHNVTKSVSTACLGVRFLLHSRVLYELCAFGLQDSHKEVCLAARAIVLYLLQSRLLMCAATWGQLLEALTPVLPVLQGFAGEEGALGSAIVNLSETESQSGEGPIPRTDRLRASLRLLLAKQLPVRSAGVQQLAWHLVSEEQAGHKRPHLPGTVLAGEPNLLIPDVPLRPDTETIGKSVFKEDAVCKVYGIFMSEAVDLAVKKSAAEQLTIMMQDTILHGVLKKQGAVEKVISLLHQAVHKDGRGLECMVRPCLTLLRRLVYHDPCLRHRLAYQPTLLLSLLRVLLVYQSEAVVQLEVSVLLSLLLFDEVAQIEKWSDSYPLDGCDPQPLSLPLVVEQRFHLPLVMATHHVVSPHRVIPPPPSDPLVAPPARDAIRLGWNLAWHQGVEALLQAHAASQLEATNQGFPELLRMNGSDVMGLRLTHMPCSLQLCLEAVSRAASHGEAKLALLRLRLQLLNDALLPQPGAESKAAQMLLSMDWRSTLKRFLVVRPVSNADEKLLGEVLAFLQALLHAQGDIPDHSMLQWILLLLKEESNHLLDLLNKSNTQVDARHTVTESPTRKGLLKELSSLFNALVRALGCSPDKQSLAASNGVRCHLAALLLGRLKEADSSGFYELPSLEATLRGMAHATALPGWSVASTATQPNNLRLQYLASLQEIVLSFSIGREGNGLSFLGKGVTKSAVVCLRQLASEMSDQAENQDWVSPWSWSRKGSGRGETAAQLGLTWLISLWVDRDLEVRLASLGLGTALTSEEQGCMALVAACQNISGGLWGTALKILLDQYESSMVRLEAASILQNLLVLPMPASADEAGDGCWQGPCVHDEDTDLSLVGLPALLALLYHCRFYQHFAGMIANCCREARLVYASPPQDGKSSHGESSSASAELSDALGHPGGSPAASNPHPGPSCPSTSSTWDHLIPGNGVDGTRTGRYPANRLSAQGQSESEGQESVNSEGTQDAQWERRGVHADSSVVTPHLVSGMCRLVRNVLALAPEMTAHSLLQHQILSSLNRCADAGVLGASLCEIRNPTQTLHLARESKALVLSLLDLQAAVCELVEACAILSLGTVLEGSLLGDLLQNLLAVFSQTKSKILDVEVQQAVHRVWEKSLSLQCVLLRKAGPTMLPPFVSAACHHWGALVGCLKTCLKMSSSNRSLHIATMQFLAMLLVEESKRKLSLKSPENDGDEDDGVAPEAEDAHPHKLCLQKADGSTNGKPISLDTGGVSRKTRSVRAERSRESRTRVGEGERRVRSSASMGAASGDPATLMWLLDRDGSWEAPLAGSQLCKIILQCFECRSTDDLLGVHATSALCCLLAVSASAKNYARQAGLIEGCVEQAKQAHSKLELDSLEQAKPAPRKKEDRLLRELRTLLEVLRNCLYESEDCKVAASDERLAAVLLALWPYLLADDSTLLAALRLLCVFTTSCRAACLSCCIGGTGTCATAGGGSSLVHAVIRLCSVRAGDSSAVERHAFTLLSNLLLSHEGKGVLQKSNFLQQFASLHPPKLSRASSPLVLHWLGLLVNLTTSEDGQQMVLRLGGSLELLLEMAGHQQAACHRAATLVLHNLCFSTANKAIILANEKAVAFLARCLENETLEMRSLGSSALWALLYNSQKAKVSLKNPSIKRKVDDALKAHRKGVRAEDFKLYTYCLKSLENVSTLLNT